MKNTGKHKTILEICFIIYFIFMFLSKQLGYSADDIQYKLALVFSMVFLLVKICLDGYTKREWSLFILFISLAILSTLVNGKIALIFTVLTVFSMKNVSLKRLCKYLLGTELFIFGNNLITHFSNGRIVDNTVRMNTDGTIESITRNALGFTHPNALHSWLVVVFCLVIYLNYSKLNYIHYIIMLIISLAFYSIDKSRSGLLISILLLCLTYGLPYLKRFKIIRSGIILSPTILAVTMIFLVEIYGKHYSIVEKINTLLMNRVMFASNFLYNYPVSLLGSNTVDEINGSIIDSGFAELYIRYGLFIFLLSIIINTYMVVRMLRSNDYAALSIAIVFQVYNLTEPYGINIFINISYIFIYKYIISKSSIINVKKEVSESVEKEARVLDYGTQRTRGF